MVHAVIRHRQTGRFRDGAPLAKRTAPSVLSDSLAPIVLSWLNAASSNAKKKQVRVRDLQTGHIKT